MLTEEQFDEMVRLLLADIEAMVPLTFTHGKPVSEANIRLLAVLMRKWLVDGDLQRILAVNKASASFNVQANSKAVDYASRSGLFRYFLTGGVQMNGTPTSYIYDSPAEFSGVDCSFMRQGRISLPLKRFLSQPRLMYEGQWFTSEEVIRFVTNKLGGNHLDFERTGQWEKLDRANRYLAYGGPMLEEAPSGTEVYLILEPSSLEIIGGAHLELLAIAASFVQMEIDGVQLMRIVTKPSLRGRLKKLFGKRPNIRMMDFKTPEEPPR